MVRFSNHMILTPINNSFFGRPAGAEVKVVSQGNLGDHLNECWGKDPGAFEQVRPTKKSEYYSRRYLLHIARLRIQKLKTIRKYGMKYMIEPRVRFPARPSIIMWWTDLELFQGSPGHLSCLLPMWMSSTWRSLNSISHQRERMDVGLIQTKPNSLFQKMYVVDICMVSVLLFISDYFT